MLHFELDCLIDFWGGRVILATNTIFVENVYLQHFFSRLQSKLAHTPWAWRGRLIFVCLERNRGHGVHLQLLTGPYSIASARACPYACQAVNVLLQPRLGLVQGCLTV